MVFLGFSFVFFCFSYWPKALLKLVELTKFIYKDYGAEEKCCYWEGELYKVDIAVLSVISFCQ